MPKIPKKYRDLAARAGWTALQAGLGVLTLEALGLPKAWVVIFAPAYSVAKSWVATKVGNRDTVTFTDPNPKYGLRA